MNDDLVEPRYEQTGTAISRRIPPRRPAFAKGRRFIARHRFPRVSI